MTIKIELEPLRIIDLLHELRHNAQAYLRLGYSLIAHTIAVQYDRQQPTEHPQDSTHKIL